jgi:staphylococcal nuclease domain-containing protein 1
MAAPSSEQQQSLAAITKSVLSGDTLILRGPVVQANALPR